MVSSRRGVRAAGAGIQNVSCLVDGCDSDLSSCREYHRRHKVCEAHSKTPIVLVGGKEQRFCQQCSRFHLLGEFDEVKRSCRKRLDGHNRRRRKPQHHLTNPRNLFTDQQGHAFVSYQSLYNHITPNPYWAVKNREPDPYRNRQPAPVITRQDHSLQYAQNYKEGKRFPFLQDGGVSISRNSSSTLDVLVPQHVNTFSSSESSGGGQMLSEGFVQVLESECAPSLLSSPAQSASFYPAPLVLATSDHIPLGQPLVRDLQHSILDKYPCMQAPSAVSSTGIYHMGISEDHAGTVLVPDTNGADFGYLGTFDGSPDDQSPSGPFPWQ